MYSTRKITHYKYYVPCIKWSSINGIRGTATSEVESVTSQSTKAFEEIPVPAIVPLIGTGWVFLPLIGRYQLSRSHLAFRQKHALYGDLIREKLGPLDFVFSFRPEHLELVYANEGVYPNRGEFNSIKFYRESRKQWYKTAGLVALNGKEWWDLRSKVQKHILKPKVVLAYLGAMQTVARDLVTKIRPMRDADGEVPNLMEEIYKWALESVALVGLDTRLGCLQNNLPANSEGMKMIYSVQTQFELINKLEMVPFYKYFYTPNWRRFTKAADVFTEIAFKYVNNALEKLKREEAIEDKEVTLLQALLLTKGLDLSGAMVTVVDMLMAGVDTTSHSVGFLLYHLAKNQDKQEALYSEIKSLLPSKEDRINDETFGQLRYLKACMKESQRLCPITPGIARVLENAVVLSGYRIPAGVTVLVVLQEIARKEQYFQDALLFKPERWLERKPLPHRFIHLPFGFGTRSCIGRRLAELEIISVVTEIIRNFKVEYHHEDIGMLTRLIATPDKPLRFKFIER